MCAVVGALAFGALGACHDEPSRPPTRQPPPPRRVIAAPPGAVRSLPPHAIRVDGVGPYRLGRPLYEMLENLPSPRMPVLDIQGLISCSVIRAEDDGVLITGPNQGDATLIAVVHADIARTESGVMVGTPRRELEPQIGRPPVDPDHAHDPRLVIGRKLPNVRFLIDQDRVAAILVEQPAAAPPGEPAGSPGGGATYAGRREEAEPCAAPSAGEALAAAGVKPGAPASTVPWCLTGGTPATAVVTGDAVAVIGVTDGHLHKLAVLEVPGVMFAAPLAQRRDDDREDLVIAAEKRDSDGRVVDVSAYRWEGGRMVRVADKEVYRITATSVRWMGWQLDDVDPLLELTARGDSIVVDGALVSRDGDSIRDVAPLVPVTVPRRRHVAPEPAGALELDAGHPGDAGRDARRGG